MKDQIEALFEEYLSSEFYKDREIFLDSMQIGTKTVQLCGISALNQSDQLVSGSAAGEGPLTPTRAFFEFLERFSIASLLNSKQNDFLAVDIEGQEKFRLNKEQLCPKSPNPDVWDYAKSNGIAAHTSFKAACSGAVQELIERHQILTHWYNCKQPRQLSIDSDLLVNSLHDKYTISLYSFASADSELSVCGLFAFPKNTEHPFFYGFGSGESENLAIQGAHKEAVQRFTFLWGEEIPNTQPDTSATAFFHQEHFLFTENLKYIRRWLDGELASKNRIQLELPRLSKFNFVDITPSIFKKQIYVVKALGDCLPLTFGLGNPLLPKSVPRDVCIHPIA